MPRIHASRSYHAAATALGACMTAAALLATPVPTHATPPAIPVHQTAHFRLTTDCDEPTRAWVSHRLEAFHHALAHLIPRATGVALSPDPISVLLFDDPADYATWVGQHAPELGHHGGYFDGATRTVVAYHRSNPLSLVLHEITHAVMGDVFTDPHYRRYSHPSWPVWFDEGFAEYASAYTIAPNGHLDFATVQPARLATLADALLTDRLPPLTTILRARPADFSGPRMALWYAAAWGLVDYLLTTPGVRTQVPAWISRLRAGEDGIVAFRQVFGTDLEGLDIRLRQHIARRAVADVPTTELLGPDGLDGWTVHDAGAWSVDASIITGRAVATTAGAPTWSYLTSAVRPTDAVELQLEIDPGDTAELGLVLGHHAVDAYPYHTLVDLRPDTIGMRRVVDASTVQPLARAEVDTSRLPPASAFAGPRWHRVRLTLRHGVASIWLDGDHILSARASRPDISLLGLVVHAGAARFRHLVLAPLDAYPAGPAAARPPTSRPARTR